MKRLLYTVMFLVSAIALVLMFITPIYKFDEDKINQNNTEMIATIIDPTLAIYRNKADFSKMDKDSQEEFKKNFKTYNEFALAIIEVFVCEGLNIHLQRRVPF